MGESDGSSLFRGRREKVGRRCEDAAERRFGEIALRCVEGAPFDEISQAVLQAALELTGSTLGCVGAVDAQTATLRVVAVSPPSSNAALEERVLGALDPWLAAPRVWEGADAVAELTGPRPGAPVPERALAAPASLGGATVGVLLVFGAVRPYGAPTVTATARLASLWGASFARAKVVETLQSVAPEDETLLSHHPDGVAVVADGRCVYANTALCEILGVRCEELRGRDPAEFVAPAFRQVLLLRHATGQGGTRSTPTEYRVQRPDGSAVTVEVVSKVISWGGRLAQLSVLRDVSGRRETERLLSRRREILQTLADFDQLVGHLSSPLVLQAALRFIQGVAASGRLGIVLCGPDGGVRHAHLRGESPASLEMGAEVQVAGTALQRAFVGAGPVYVPDLSLAGDEAGLVQSLRAGGLRALLIVPLRTAGTNLGALHVSSPSPDGIAEDRRELLALLAPRLAEALRNSFLHERLQESERRYRHIFDTVPVSIWEEDFSLLKAELLRLRASGVEDLGTYVEEHPEFAREAAALVRVLDVNDYTLRLYEAKTKEELLGALDRVFTPESYPAFAAQLAALAEGKRFYECEGTNRTLRGRKLTVMVKAEFPPSDADLSRVTVSVTDLSRRQEAEEALRDRTRLEALVAGISTGFLNAGVGRTRDAARDALALLGAFSGADRCYVGVFARGRRQTGRVLEWRRSDALPTAADWLRRGARALPWLSGLIARGHSVGIRTSLEELPPEAVREMEVFRAQDVRSLLLVPLTSGGTRVGLLGIDALGSERVWPAGIETLLKVVGEIFVNAREREIAQEELRRARDELEERVRERTAALERANRALEEDIAARQQAQAEKEQLEGQLRRSRILEAVGQLAGGVAHDFNNILGSVIGCLYAARLRAAADPAVLEELERAQTLCKRGGDLTRQLLTVARRRPAQPSFVRVPDLLGEVRVLLERTLPKDIATRVEVEEGLPVVHADRALLAAALLNLGVNARDAMPRGGFLRLAARREVGEGGGDWVVISVADTGVGIPEALQDRVFDPFFTTKGPGVGTGLGLSMVDATLREYGGSVSLRSLPGQGATFTLRLPAQLDPTAPHPVERATREHPLTANLILVVEDEESVERMVSQVLETHGYATLSAATGLEALETVRDHAGRLGGVILDLVLPELGGEDVHRLLRATAPEVPILLITGREDLARALPGETPVLPKPFTPDELMRELGALLSTSSSRP